LRESAGQTDPLPLSARHRRRIQERFVPLRQAPDEIIGACRLSGRVHGLGIGGAVSETDGIGKGFAYQDRPFKCVTDSSPQRLMREFG
jgi:hypothetical protein